MMETGGGDGASAEPAAPTSTGRDLVLLFDGTNNTITGGVADTNVLRLCDHLNRHPSPRRVIYYDPGVGSPDSAPPTGLFDWLKRTRERVSGLAFGRGVYEDIADAYRFLMRNWSGPDDRIYVFGFSRGAFTARAVVGIVNLFGIMRPAGEPLVPAVVRVYFSLPDRVGNWYQGLTRLLHDGLARKEKAAAEAGGRTEPADARPDDPRDVLAAQIRTLFTAPGQPATIHWVGVWDTVESVGLPGPLSQSNPSTATLKPRVRNVRHAVAFDEHRWSFVPRLYEEPRDIDSDGQTLKQRWFPGAHCDVGGSYAIDHAGLSELALRWMIDEVAGPDELGLPAYAPDPRAQRVCHDATYDLPWWALAGLTVRSMHPRTSRKPHEPIAVIAIEPRPPIDATVWARPRAWWPVGLALLAGFVLLGLPGLLRTHRCVFCQWTIDRHLAAVRDMLATLLDQRFEFGGLVSYVGPGLWSGVELGWIVLWDFAFIGAWGYLLARVASRAFAWLTGLRDPASTGPWAVWLGMMPLVLVSMNVLRDALIVLAALMPAVDAELLQRVFGALAHVCGFIAWLGLVGCLPLLLIRLYLALPGVRTYRL